MASKSYIRLLAFCITGLMGNQVHAWQRASDWAAVTAPTKNFTGQSIGSYSSGCVAGAVALPVSGPGYQVMRLSRNRYYGHASLVQFIQNLGQAVADEKMGSLLVGDLGQPRGGPTPSGHRSHQTGLDVDIWFLLGRRPEGRLLTVAEREALGAPSMLDAGSDGVDYHRWTHAHEKILRTAALQPEVDRIFVNPAIKQELCKHKSDASDSAWLRKIRPWWKHDDHFHVRLKCPDTSPYCEKQLPVSQGDGCDASLAWWFSKEAKSPSKTKKPAAPPRKLPALCRQVINDASDQSVVPGESLIIR